MLSRTISRGCAMESKELYRVLLGLSEPWTVERVELDMARQEVSVHVTTLRWLAVPM
jgi:hypothetical protein